MPEVLIGIALLIFLQFTAALTLSRASPGHATPCLRLILWATGTVSVTLYLLGIVAIMLRSDNSHLDVVSRGMLGSAPPESRQPVDPEGSPSPAPYSAAGPVL